MTDLIKQLQYLSRVTKDYDQEHMTSADYEMIPAVTKLAADRIQELEREADEMYVLACTVKDRLKAKLAKAVSLALEECPFGYGTGGYNDWWYDRRAVLAKLEGKE